MQFKPGSFVQEEALGVSTEAVAISLREMVEFHDAPERTDLSDVEATSEDSASFKMDIGQPDYIFEVTVRRIRYTEGKQVRCGQFFGDNGGAHFWSDNNSAFCDCGAQEWQPAPTWGDGSTDPDVVALRQKVWEEGQKEVEEDHDFVDRGDGMCQCCGSDADGL